MALPACTCLHVEGGSDPAHGHGYYQCPDCGGLCCSERWTGHAAAGLRWMELMMQQHRHGRVVVQGLNYIQDRMLAAVEQIAALVPPAQQKQAVRDMLRRELANLSHIWHQSTLGDYLYQTGDIRGGPTTARIYEESAAQLGAKLAAITDGASPQAFMERFAYADAIAPEEALRRAAHTPPPASLPEAQEQPTVEIPIQRETVMEGVKR